MAATGVLWILVGILVILPNVDVAKQSSRNLIQDITDAKEFKKLLRTRTNVLVIFAKSEKDANRNMKIYEQVAEEVKGSATLAFVNCEDKKLCKKIKVSLSSDVQLKHYKDGEFNKDYDRKNTVKSMVNFLRDPTGDIPWEEDATATDVQHLDSPTALTNLLKKEKRPILIMFYAPWCGFCKRLKPDFAAAATELLGQSVLAGMDVDRPENHKVRQDYEISGYPTIYYFENGKKKFKFGGENNKDGIISWMKNPSEPKEKEKEPEWADEESYVVHLGDDDFDAYLSTHPSALVMFYAPWCGHCKAMKPEYTQAAATMMEEEVTGALVAVDATMAKTLGDKYGVKGFPTVKYFKDGEVAFDFNERKADQIVEFMKDPKEPPPPPPPEPSWEETESEIIHLTEENFKPTLKKKKHTLVMFYAPWCGHCKKAKPEMTAAAEQFKTDNKVAFAAIDCTKFQAVCSAHDVSGYPTFKYFNYGKNAQKYAGGREEADFVAFMKDPLNPLASAPPPSPSPDTMWADVEGNENINHLNEANFESFIKQNPAVLVMFYAPWCGHCKAMKPAYGEAATTLKDENIPGVLAAVDATAERSLGERYGVKGYPTIKYFKNGAEEMDYDKTRTAKDIVSFMKNPVKAPPPPVEEKWSDVPSKVVHLSTTSFKEELAGKEALVMFYAPWCGHCKKAKPEFQEAAAMIGEGQILAAVDCTVDRDLCQGEDVKGYPTLRYYKNGQFIEKYASGRSKDSFVEFMKSPPKPTGKKTEL